MQLHEREALLEVLFHVFDSYEDIDGLVYLDIQKIFYHLRERLEDENTVSQLLPYYWYEDGIVSDAVHEAVNHGLEVGALEAEPTARTGSGKWIKPPNGYSPSPERVDREDIETAKEEVELVLDEDYDVFSDHETKIEDIYEDAPYDFQRYFKLNILFAVEEFASGRPLYLGIENLASEISTAEAYLPLEPEFEEFNTLFSRYVNVSKQYLDVVDDDTRKVADRFKQLSDSIWGLYCQQLRLLEHDPEYESKLDEWEEEYERTRKLVANDLVDFRRLVDEEFEVEIETTRVSEDSSWGRMATDFLDE